jgi:hypothetical protein
MTPRPQSILLEGDQRETLPEEFFRRRVSVPEAVGTVLGRYGKAAIDAAGVPGRIYEGKHPSLMDVFDMLDFAAVPGVGPGLGSGPRIAKPYWKKKVNEGPKWKSRTVEALGDPSFQGQFGKKDPKGQQLLNALRKVPGVTKEDLDLLGVDKVLADIGQQRVPIADVYAAAKRAFPSTRLKTRRFGKGIVQKLEDQSYKAKSKLIDNSPKFGAVITDTINKLENYGYEHNDLYKEIGGTRRPVYVFDQLVDGIYNNLPGAVEEAASAMKLPDEAVKYFLRQAGRHRSGDSKVPILEKEPKYEGVQVVPLEKKSPTINADPETRTVSIDGGELSNYLHTDPDYTEKTFRARPVRGDLQETEGASFMTMLDDEYPNIYASLYRDHPDLVDDINSRDYYGYNDNNPVTYTDAQIVQIAQEFGVPSDSFNMVTLRNTAREHRKRIDKGMVYEEKHGFGKDVVFHQRSYEHTFHDNVSTWFVNEQQSALHMHPSSRKQSKNYPYKKNWWKIGLRDAVQEAVSRGLDSISWPTAKAAKEHGGNFSKVADWGDDKYHKFLQDEYGKAHDIKVEKVSSKKVGRYKEGSVYPTNIDHYYYVTNSEGADILGRSFVSERDAKRVASTITEDPFTGEKLIATTGKQEIPEGKRSVVIGDSGDGQELIISSDQGIFYSSDSEAAQRAKEYIRKHTDTKAVWRMKIPKSLRDQILWGGQFYTKKAGKRATPVA